MRKMLIYLFICLLIFIGGVSYGVQGEKQSEPPVNHEPIESEIKVIETEPTLKVIDDKENRTIAQSNELHEKSEESMIYKTATLFGQVVSSLYEIGVGLIYQFVNLFFD